MSNDGHVTDVGPAVHEGPDLFDSEAIDNVVSMPFSPPNALKLELQLT